MIDVSVHDWLRLRKEKWRKSWGFTLRKERNTDAFPRISSQKRCTKIIGNGTNTLNSSCLDISLDTYDDKTLCLNNMFRDAFGNPIQFSDNIDLDLEDGTRSVMVRISGVIFTLSMFCLIVASSASYSRFGCDFHLLCAINISF